MPEAPGQLTLQMRIELEDVTPTVWRRILVPTSIRMAKLHDIFQATMGCSRYSNHKSWSVTPFRVSSFFIVAKSGWE